MRRRAGWAARSVATGVALASILAGCAQTPDGADAVSTGAYRIVFEDRPVPEAFQRQGEARRAAENAPGGVWGVVAGLRRAERAQVRNIATGDEITVPLFNGPTGGAVIILSRAAADEIGLAEAPVTVTVTAVRREPSLQSTRNGF